MNEDAFPPQFFRSLPVPLLAWFDAHARILPWRDRAADPYRVWISEIMLQQTRVEAVKPYFTRFLDALPDIQALASASDERLMKLWEGLGYYSRVRNLKRAAVRIVEEFGGVFPHDPAILRSLPGIGEYTAGAIASIAFGLPEPAVDGNVVRVLTRLAAWRGDATKTPLKTLLSDGLRQSYPVDRAGDFTQSLMELGALVCVPNGAPLCGECPLAEQCRARRENVQMEIPVKSAKKPRRIENHTVLLVVCTDGGTPRIALVKRPASGLLAGMWELPNLSGSPTADVMAALGLCGAVPGVTAKHVFSHIEWRMNSYEGTVRDSAACPRNWRWTTAAELTGAIALPSAFNAFRLRIAALLTASRRP